MGLSLWSVVTTLGQEPVKGFADRENPCTLVRKRVPPFSRVLAGVVVLSCSLVLMLTLRVL